MAATSPKARIVKRADVISDLRGVALSLTAGWSAERGHGHLDGCRRLVDAARVTNAARFDRTAADAGRTIREDAPRDRDGTVQAARALESSVGQAVHLVHMANTQCEAPGEAHVDRLLDILQRSFPSVIVQRHGASLEGRRRAILSARIRTDSTEAVAALAQSICLAFRQRFVGIEVGGRFMRIRADDTA